MNAYALACIVSVTILLGGSATGFFLSWIADRRTACGRLIATHAIACAAGFCAAVAAFYLRT